MTTLVIDAYDSFVIIIAQYLRSLGCETLVRRNDKITLEEIAEIGPEVIVLGPGPGHPKDAHYLAILERFGETVPIFGICLGHQAIAMAFGGRVIRADRCLHGKTSMIEHDAKGCFAKHSGPFAATRYHSLIVEEATLPADLVVTARSKDDGYIMGLRHRTLPIESLQFHPESICTENGIQLLSTFLTQQNVSVSTPHGGAWDPWSQKA
jgi:anthranilate synthase component 2